MAKSQEEFQEIIGSSGKCQLVVIRKRAYHPSQQQLQQTQEDNLRLQHRISYLEEQVKEMQDTSKDIKAVTNHHSSTMPSPPLHEKKRNGGHVTSISISTSSPTETEKPQIFQRGSYVTTIIGGKPIDHSSPSSKQQNITKTLIKEMNGNRSDSEHDLRHSYNQQRNQYNTMLQHSHSHQHLAPNGPMSNGPIKSMSSSKISINSDLGHFPIIKRERDKRERDYHSGRDTRNMNGGDDDVDGSSLHSRKSMNGDGHGSVVGNGRLSEVANHHYHSNGGYSSYSVEQLNGWAWYKLLFDLAAFIQHFRMDIFNNAIPMFSSIWPNSLSEYTQRKLKNLDYHLENKSRGTDMRSVRSLDFEKDTTLGNGLQETKQHQYRKHREVDYTSDSVADPLTNVRYRNGMRPTPPKKPLRLSLQRAQSLQTIEATAAATILDLDKKRAYKRTHRGGNKTPDLQHYIENSFNGGSQPQLQTASLGRHKHI